MHKRNKLGTWDTIPCSKCPDCIKRRVNGWAFRLQQEEKISSSAFFLTITYDSKYLPISKNGYATLVKKDMQDYMKRLRKSHPPDHAPLKYFLCGEYGGETKRPHYHMLLFNADIKLIDPAWSQGLINFGKVEPASILYVFKYMDKGKFKPQSNDDRQPEFQLMSKGLGANYIRENMVAWHRADLDNRSYVNLPGGQKTAMPRYYREKIYSEMERKRLAYFAASEYAAEMQKNLVSPEIIAYSDPYYYEKTVADLDRINRHKYNLKSRSKI